jgi:hypothetical protein
MKKRVLAAVLWFYAGWVVGALLAALIGISAILGPIIGISAAALVAGDPRGLIWTRPLPARRAPESLPGSLADAA